MICDRAVRTAKPLISVPDTQGYLDWIVLSCAGTRAAQKTQELLHLDDAARGIVREDQLITSGRAALLHPPRHSAVAELRQERRRSMEGGPLLDCRACTRAQSIHAFDQGQE
jgi:hypothetical protein